MKEKENEETDSEEGSKSPYSGIGFLFLLAWWQEYYFSAALLVGFIGGIAAYDEERPWVALLVTVLFTGVAYWFLTK